MLDDADQRSLAKRIHPILEQHGLSVVFVGSTAIVGLGLFPRTSKDADALAAPELPMSAARRILGEIAEENDLSTQERGWGTVSLVKLDRDGEEAWTVDLLVPEGGIIPAAAAAIIHEHAIETDIGPTAIPEHVLATKAVAYGDCLGKGDMDAAAKYESDLLQLEKTLGEDIDWHAVKELLATFPSGRRVEAARKIHEVLGQDLGFREDPDPSVA